MTREQEVCAQLTGKVIEEAVFCEAEDGKPAYYAIMFTDGSEIPVCMMADVIRGRR